eukprot:2051705-Prymnesium_polylepis.1
MREGERGAWSWSEGGDGGRGDVERGGRWALDLSDAYRGIAIPHLLYRVGLGGLARVSAPPPAPRPRAHRAIAERSGGKVGPRRKRPKG